MLLEFINEKTIRLNVEAKDRFEAIKAGGEVLLKNNIINSEYIDAMITTSNDLKGYIVIAPRVALPHARPETGAITTGMSLITLNKPVYFGNQDNDPVSLVICVAAADNESHINALKDLVKLLDSEENIQNIINSKNKGDIIKLISNLCLENKVGGGYPESNSDRS
jgi:mannitol/fructose-specific phosphotransferase system IIA component (Ntr-type)